MSHGGGGDENAAEPDLTPLLDLVLQLLMFFIVNVNFVKEQVSQDVILPKSASAKAVEKADAKGTLFLNQTTEGLLPEKVRNALKPEEKARIGGSSSIVLVPGKPIKTFLEAKSWLKDEYETRRQLSKSGEVETVVYLRPHENLELVELFKLMEAIKSAGFKNMKVRARVGRGKSS